MQLLGRLGKLAAMGLAAAGLVVAAGAAVKFVQAAIEDEASAKRMATQFRNSAGATKSQIAATEQWITAQGRAGVLTTTSARIEQSGPATGDVGRRRSSPVWRWTSARARAGPRRGIDGAGEGPERQRRCLIAACQFRDAGKARR